MLLVGLTGGIGSGKSEVARRLAALGAVLIDADVLARDVVAVGTPGLAEVMAAFGPAVVGADGSLDRDALAARVFGDPEALAQLNAIVHPLVGARTAELVAAAVQADPNAIVVNDVPLLVEAGLASRYGAVVVVAATPETQLRRLVEQRGMSEADARARIAAQAPLEDKLAVADYVVRNDGDLDALDTQVRELWQALVAKCVRQGGL